MDIYFVFWVIIQYYLILFIKLFKLWPLGALRPPAIPHSLWFLSSLLSYDIYIYIYIPHGTTAEGMATLSSILA